MGCKRECNPKRLADHREVPRPSLLVADKPQPKNDGYISNPANQSDRHGFDILVLTLTVLTFSKRVARIELRMVLLKPHGRTERRMVLVEAQHLTLRRNGKPNRLCRMVEQVW